jgi:hypothetical protein
VNPSQFHLVYDVLWIYNGLYGKCYCSVHDMMFTLGVIMMMHSTRYLQWSSEIYYTFLCCVVLYELPLLLDITKGSFNKHSVGEWVEVKGRQEVKNFWEIFKNYFVDFSKFLTVILFFKFKKNQKKKKNNYSLISSFNFLKTFSQLTKSTLKAI